MNPVTYENLLRNYALMDALHAQARRERNAAIDRLVFAPIAAFIRGVLAAPSRVSKPRTRMLHRSATC